jgi:hypothetical protein
MAVSMGKLLTRALASTSDAYLPRICYSRSYGRLKANSKILSLCLMIRDSFCVLDSQNNKIILKLNFHLIDVKKRNCLQIKPHPIHAFFHFSI